MKYLIAIILLLCSLVARAELFENWTTQETGALNKGNDAPENKSGRVLADERINWTDELIDKFV